MNLLWTVFNIVILGVATAVAWESQQRRQTVRVTMAISADVLRADGSLIPGVTADMSSGGVMIRLDEDAVIPNGEPIQLIFPVLSGNASIPATVVGYSDGGPPCRVAGWRLCFKRQRRHSRVPSSRRPVWWGRTAGSRPIPCRLATSITW
jgi:cellulose synthase (UDP-forming)